MKNYLAPSIFLLFCLSGSAQAGAYQSWEEDTATLGNNHAGAAAHAESAAAEYYNPASIITLKHRQISVGGNLFFISKIEYSL